MSFRRVTSYACLAVAVGWGFFPSSAHACGLLNWLWGGNSATTAYYSPYTSYYAPTAGCGTGYVAQRPQVSWMPVTNYATGMQAVPVTSYRPNLFGGGLFGCNSYANQANRVPITNYMPVAAPVAPVCNTCPQTSYSLPVETVYAPPVSCCPTNTCPTTSYAPPVTYSAPACPSNACSSCNACSPSTTSYSVPTTSYPTTTTYGPATTTIVEPSSSCSCGSHASSAPVGTGALVGNPTSTYSNSGSTYGSSTVPADSRPTLSGNEAPRIDGNSLGLPETSYSTNYGSSSLSLSAPEVRVDSSVTPGPIRSDSNVQFGVPTVRPFDSSARPMPLHAAATESTDNAAAFGVAPMRDPETRDRDGRLLAPPLLDPRAKTASLPPVGVRPAFDDRIPVMAASFKTETPASLVPVSASLASSAPAIENTGLRLIEEAPVAHTAAKVAIDYPVSQTGFAAAAPEYSANGSNVTQLDESVWQSARP